MDIISTLRSSNAELLKAEAADLAKWSKLRHVKDDFELFLNFNIAEVEFKAADGKDCKIICTSNTTLVELFSLAKDNERAKIAKKQSAGIKTRDKTSVDTWDLVENKRKTVKLKSWQIVNFISITPENILILDELVRKLLKYS